MCPRKSSSSPSAKRKFRPPPRRMPDKLIIPQEAETFTVYPDQAGLRLDLFLKLRLRWRSRAKVQELIEHREVTANGLRVDRSYRVKMSEEIRLPLPPPGEEAFRIADIPLKVLYEDDQLVILNKQPGIVVHPAGRHHYDTIINALHLRYRDLEDPEKDIIPKLAHRIDRDTSGVLICCKTRRHERSVPLVFERSDASKQYLAIAEGVFSADSGIIDLPIGREDGPHNTALMMVRRDGQSARTGYEVIERFAHFTLVRCTLFTGRMHQIRVHLQAIGHPIVCDTFYGRRKELKLSEARPLRRGEHEHDRVILDRQALHAFRVGFTHPVTKKPMIIEAPLPKDMQETLEALRGK